MAAEMLEKILSAEKEAKEKLEKTENEAQSVVDNASVEAKKIIEAARVTAEGIKNQRIADSHENAKKQSLEAKKRAEAVCEQMADKCRERSEECTRLITQQLFS